MVMVSNITRGSNKIKTEKFPLEFAVRMLLVTLTEILNVKQQGESRWGQLRNDYERSGR